MNGVSPRDGRSVSATLHDRSRMIGSAVTNASASGKHKHPRHSSVHPMSPQLHAPTGTGTSPHTARETFLNYFFGQNGPGPLSGSSVERSHSGLVPVPTGRDVSGVDTPGPGGLLAPKRSLDGNSAAFDMKSLGKHIEAVRNGLHSCVSALIWRLV